MTELTPETVTDADVDSFFSNNGKIEDIQLQVDENPVKNDTKEEITQPKVEKKYEPKDDAPVNYGALHEERTRRKAEAERAAKAEARAQELERQLQEYSQRQQEPSYDEDPVEALRIKAERMEQFLNLQAQHELTKRQEAEYWNRIKESEIAYKQDKPDFDDAINFLAKTRLEELQDLGWGEDEAKKVLQDEIKWIANKAYADEVNPSERFYNLAKRRGFAAKEQTPEIDKSADIKLLNIEKGMKTNKQLPPASKSIQQDLTAESLADMNVDALTSLTGNTEFDKAWNKLFGS